MLRGEHGRGHQHRDLQPLLDGLEGRADGDLRLAVPHVTDHDAVHGRGPLEVGLDLQDGAQLVRGLLVREGGLHLRLPGGVVPEGPTSHVGARRVQREQVLGEVADGLAHAGPSALPLATAQA